MKAPNFLTRFNEKENLHGNQRHGELRKERDETRPGCACTCRVSSSRQVPRPRTNNTSVADDESLHDTYAECRRRLNFMTACLSYTTWNESFPTMARWNQEWKLEQFQDICPETRKLVVFSWL